MNAQMNSTFRGAAAQFISKQLPMTHKQEVCALYRKSLRLLDSWAIDRTIFNEEATKVRAAFDEGSTCEPDSARATALMRGAYKEIEDYVHVDRYIRPYMPSGSSFMRNPPPPLDACYPLGIPDEVHAQFNGVPKEVEVDMSRPVEGRMSKAGQVLVDLATKRFY
ncbi:unnamed protein product [Scytosiphon promiscuus]